MRPYYEQDGITIYHGDCREILPSIGTVGGIVTDPPYGMGRFSTDGKDFLVMVGPALRAAWALVADPGSMFVFMSTAEVVNVANAVGRDFKRLLWLYKPADMTYPLGGWLLKSEAILWFHRGDSLGLVERRPFRHDCYVSTRTGLEGVEGHPTVKPLDVVQDFVARLPGTVLDPFLGSGTTLRAARNLGKPAIGIEIEERYCEIAARRLDQGVLELR
jgi:site-specific DNA-methyltransferase (adenine-specific)